ncbi:hypothetical protein FKM82_024229 [Ascaphus truei]
MNPTLAVQYPVYGWMAQEPPCYKPTLQQSNDVPFPTYEVQGSDCTPGPSSVDWKQKNRNDSKLYQKAEGTWKRKRKTETSDTGSDSSESTNDKQGQNQKYRKRKAKRRRY